MTRRDVAAYAALAVIAILALYVRTLYFGLYWDDFDDLRPWTWAGLGSTFVGHYQPWAREGIYFYRPLTSVYFAASTALFGLNGVALHVIPLFTLTIAATLTGVFVQRETGSRAAGLIGTLFYAVHPLTATSIGPWIANQYQGFVVIAVLCALLLWRGSAVERQRLSVPLAAVLIAAAWFKEDGMLLGPALLTIQSARASLTRDVPMPSRRLVLAVLGLAIGLVLWRNHWLPSPFGYGIPDIASMAANLSRAWRYALVWHTGAAPLAPMVTLVKTAIAIGALRLVLTRRATAAARLAVTGLALMAVMNLPLALVSSENRWHVIGLSAVLISTAVVSALRQPARWAIVVVVAALFAASAWERISAFAPCSADAREHDRWALTLPELPPEMHQWLSTRDAACRAGRFEAFQVPMRDLRWGQR